MEDTKPMTVVDQLDTLKDQLRVLVNWFNQRSSWDAALRAQIALIAVDDISAASDADFEKSFP